MLSLFPSRAVVLEVWSFQVRWYGVLYVAAFVLARWLAPRLQSWRRLTLTGDQWLGVVTGGIAGVLIGGRLGYVLFYEPGYFAQQPWQVLRIWDGGMSAHGGFLGVALALWLASRRLTVPFLALTDVVIVPAALGLALGRVGNFINQELFLSSAAHVAAIAKDLLIAAAACVHLRFFGKTQPGGTTVLFLIMYSVLRFLTEYARIQYFAPTAGLTRGQLLTLPTLLLGVLLMLWLRGSRHKLS
jgi:phosphatidylglycerol:prolipoprotein diacylglycerol transferase